MNKNIKSYIISLFILLITLFNTIFIVGQTKQAIIFQFGQPMRVITKIGLNLKVPFIQNVITIDNRLQSINTEDKEVIASDQKRLIISAFAKYRIVDPLAYYTSVGNKNNFESKFSTIFDSSLRQVIGGVPFNNLLSEKRKDIMNTIKNVLSLKAKEFGINIIDVRITRSDLPKANSEAIYSRMQTERQREAKEIRSEGDEMSKKIIAGADKDKAFLLADANKQAQITMGEGDAEANKIYAQAYSKDPDFFKFYRSMQAYKNSLTNADKTKIILSPENEFLKELTK